MQKIATTNIYICKNVGRKLYNHLAANQWLPSTRLSAILLYKVYKKVAYIILYHWIAEGVVQVEAGNVGVVHQLLVVIRSIPIILLQDHVKRNVFFFVFFLRKRNYFLHYMESKSPTTIPMVFSFVY